MTRPLRLAFMGTPVFAVPALDALVAAGHAVATVYCQPPRPAGRGHKLRPSPVQARAETLGLPVRCPLNFKDEADRRAFADLDLDAAIVAAYGLILPKPILAAPRLGCINIHGSLLPRWRGAAPLQRAILAGDTETGITIMQMEAGLDTGPMLLRGALPIEPTTTAAILHDQMAALGARLIVEALDGLDAGTIAPVPQPEEGMTYAAKLAPEEGHIDWRSSAAAIDRLIRALNPSPGVWFDLNGERVKLLKAEWAETAPVPTARPDLHAALSPGTVLDAHLTIQCGEGVIMPRIVQRPGRQAMEVAAFLRGTAIAQGTVLPLPA